MVRVNDDYVIQIDNYNYSVMRDAHRKTTRKERNGETVEIDAYVTVGHYSGLPGAIRGVIKDMNKRELSDGIHTLQEAIDIVVNNNNRFNELLENALRCKE